MSVPQHTAVSRQASRPAGASPLPDIRTKDPGQAGLAAYAAAVSHSCPYLGPTMASGQTWWTRYRMPPAARALEVEAALFAAGAEAAERVRDQVKAGHRLPCEVIALEWDDSHARQATVLSWPHWALKHLYTPIGVLFGKFSPGQEFRCRDGSRVAPPPTLILAVRAAIPARDPDLLTSTPDLARAVSTARDDHRSVWATVPGLTPGADPATAWPAVRAWAGQVPHRP